MGNKFQFPSSPQSGDLRLVSQPEMPGPNDLKQSSLCHRKKWPKENLKRMFSMEVE